jgi:flagellar basal-body rod protein FlgB
MIGMPMFGLEEKSLSLCEMRSGMLAHNIANADTPNYKATDLNFHEALNQAHSSSLNITNSNHLQNKDSVDGYKSYYRIPTQTNQDGNTVDDDIERQNFIENALRYQASLGFAQNKATSILKAIKGE